MGLRLTILLALALLAVLGALPAAAHAALGDGTTVEVRVVARRLADGHGEFATQQRGVDGAWADRQLPWARFFWDTESFRRWVEGSPIKVAAPGGGGVAAVRVATRLLADGRMEFALEVREADGAWGQRRLPRARFFPADAPVGRWLASSPLAVRLPPAAPIATPERASTERAALTALYESTDGFTWNNITNWLSAEPLGEWFGVTTDSEGRVTALSMVGNNLHGPIPAEIGGLTHLRTLNLSYNLVSGPIPAELMGLRNLRFVNLYRNRLSGSIPAGVGALQDLEDLYLAENQLSGPLPAALGDLRNLTWLNLSFNSLNGPIPAELGKLGALERLHLANNSLSGAIPAELGNLANLEELSLRENDLSGPLPVELGGLASLEVLDLEGNKLSGPIPRAFGDLTNLHGLNLWGNDLSGTIPAELGNLTKLRSLLLLHNRLTGSIPPELADLPDLLFFHVTGNHFSGCVPEGLLDVAHNDLMYLGLPTCD